MGLGLSVSGSGLWCRALGSRMMLSWAVSWLGRSLTMCQCGVALVINIFSKGLHLVFNGAFTFWVQGFEGAVNVAFISALGVSDWS